MFLQELNPITGARSLQRPVTGYSSYVGRRVHHGCSKVTKHREGAHRSSGAGVVGNFQVSNGYFVILWHFPTLANFLFRSQATPFILRLNLKKMICHHRQPWHFFETRGLLSVIANSWQPQSFLYPGSPTLRYAELWPNTDFSVFDWN